MSVTFAILKNNKIMYPAGFDPTPVVDLEFPEYGAIPPDNPWELNVTTANAQEILKNFSRWDGQLDGVLWDFYEVTTVCEQILSTINSIPELDHGTQSTNIRKNFISCGHFPGWYQNRFSKLLELAHVAEEHKALLSFF